MNSCRVAPIASKRIMPSFGSCGSISPMFRVLGPGADATLAPAPPCWAGPLPGAQPAKARPRARSANPNVEADLEQRRLSLSRIMHLRPTVDREYGAQAGGGRPGAARSETNGTTSAVQVQDERLTHLFLKLGRAQMFPSDIGSELGVLGVDAGRRVLDHQS